MPRNYSVKQTIAMIKSGIKEKSAEPKIFKIPTITNEQDEVIRFDRKDEKPNKKWYQFWK